MKINRTGNIYFIFTLSSQMLPCYFNINNKKEKCRVKGIAFLSASFFDSNELKKQYKG